MHSLIELFVPSVLEGLKDIHKEVGGCSEQRLWRVGLPATQARAAEPSTALLC
jgi:hypothetical protein